MTPPHCGVRNHEHDLLWVGIIFLVPFIFLILQWLARGAVRNHFAGGGNRVLSVRSDPWILGGYIGREGFRFNVRYLDEEGNEHAVRCLCAGVGEVWTRDDRIVKPAEPEKK